MAVSAYTREGKLKKHALLGTSFGTDPTRRQARAKFKGLYEEARGASGRGGGGKDVMKGRLQSRFDEFGKGQVSRLGEISGRQQQLQTEIAGLRDPEKEAEYDKDIAAFDAWSEQRADLNPESRFGGLSAYEPEIPEEYRSRAGAALAGMTKADKRAFGQRTGHVANVAQFYPQWFKENIGAAQGKKQTYEQQISSEVDRINKEFIPLQTEAAGRKKRIADRLELYNMFLGA